MSKKTTFQPTVEISYLIFSNMIKYVYINQLTDEQFAKALEVSTRTLRSYKEKPNSINLEHIELFLKNMGMDIYALLTV